MKKRGVFLIILLLISVIFINIIYAETTIKSYNYKDSNQNSLINAKLYIYGCTDSTCSSLTNYWFYKDSGSSSSIAVTGTPSNYNAEFHFINCYKSKEYLGFTNSYYNGDSIPITMSKQDPCSSSLLIPQITGTKQVNNQLTITINLGQVFSSSLTTLPNEVKSFYDANVDVKISIKDSNNIEVYTKTDSVTVPFGGKTHSFTWTPTTQGDYTIIITTNVKDCKCTQPQSDSSPASTSITITQPTQQCPTCLQPSAWSSCVNSQQNRTNYKCDSTTNYLCQSYLETQSCTEPPKGLCDANNECKKDKYTCTSGDVDCSCSQLKGFECKENQECNAQVLKHLSSDNYPICCSLECAAKQTNQTQPPQTQCTPGETQLCLPDENGCTQQKYCISNSTFSPCYQTNSSCKAPSTCIDLTPSGTCSQIFQGTLCLDGQLVTSALCSTNTTTTTTTTQQNRCFEFWYCASWSDCNDIGTHNCLKWEDINKCSTATSKPADEQQCSYTQPPVYSQYLQSQPFKGEGEGSKIFYVGNDGEGTSVQNLVNALIPRGFSLKLGLDNSFALLIIALFLGSITFYYLAKYKHPIKEIKQKIPIKKEEPLKSVKINDLMLNVIESLQGDEKRIAQKLIEGEGIKTSKLRDILGLNKNKMEIALSKLERRQIIKERTDDDSKLYFNDWLK